jgi:hypothetical protein
MEVERKMGKIKRLLVAVVVAWSVLSGAVACHKTVDPGGVAPTLEEVDTDKNEWVHIIKDVDPLISTIWCAFIDTREVNFWHIYLSPVRDIEFEEVFDFSPVKITLPVDFPLDGTVVRFSADRAIRLTYGSKYWDASNTPKGVLSATYEAHSGHFEITFNIGATLKGHYSGPLTIIE